MRSQKRVARSVGAVLGVLVFTFMLGSPVYAASKWTFTSPTKNTSIDGDPFHVNTMSSDGKYMYSSAHYQGIFRSTDYGKTWTDPAPSMNTQDFAFITTSSNGKYVYMSAYSGDIWFSQDYGVNWTNRTDPTLTGTRWASIDSSGDGKTSIAGTENAGVYISTDYGVTYTATTLPTNKEFYGVAVSSDGNRMLAVQYGGEGYISTDGGTNWTSVLTTGGYFEASSSASGKYLATVSPFDGIYVSNNYGQTWTKVPNTNTQTWYDVDISSTGRYMVAIDNGGDVYVSSDYGQSWVDQTAGTDYANLNYPYVSISGNGKYILTNVIDDNLYLGYNASASEVASKASLKKDELADTGQNINPLQLFSISGLLLSLIGLEIYRRRVNYS